MSRANDFLTPEEQQAVADCVREVEKTTSGEIVPVIASESYHYPGAASYGAMFLAIVLAVGIAYLLGYNDMWTFLVIFLISHALCHLLLKSVPALKRPFIPRKQMQEEVAEAAVTSFYTQGLHRTRDMTGIIIYVSVYEKKVHVLADQGINEKVDPAVWGEVVAMVTAGIRDNKPAEGLCRAIRRCGELVSTNFPIKPDDTDELPNLIIDGRAH